MQHISFFSAPPVVGQPAAGSSMGIAKNGRVTYKTEWSGIYAGIRPSEHTGEPVHFFRDGQIGGIPQTCFAFPVAQERAATITNRAAGDAYGRAVRDADRAGWLMAHAADRISWRRWRRVQRDAYARARRWAVAAFLPVGDEQPGR